MRATIILNRAKGLIRTEKTIRARKGLDNVFIRKHFIHIKRVDPFGVKPSKHLIHNDQKVDLLFRLAIDALIRFLMSQASRDILLHLLKAGSRKILAITSIIIPDQFQQAIFLNPGPITIINARIKQGGHLQPRRFSLEPMIILQSLWNAMGGKNGMEFAALAKHHPIIQNILDHHRLMLIRTILAIRDKILYTLVIASIIMTDTSHGNSVHISQEDLLLPRISQRLLHSSRLCFLQSDHGTDIPILISQDHIWIKTKDIPIPNAIGYAISMQLIAKDSGRRVHLLLVFLLNRSSRETEE